MLFCKASLEITAARDRTPARGVSLQNPQFYAVRGMLQGIYGVEGINGLIEKILADEGMIRADKAWYHGRPVMVWAVSLNGVGDSSFRVVLSPRR